MKEQDKQLLFKALCWFQILLGLTFGILETNYFGNNLFPLSLEELICDLTALSLVVLGMFFKGYAIDKTNLK